MGLKPKDIESISLKVHPLVLELTGKKTPASGLEGKFSVYHSSAVAVIYGAGGEAQYSDEVVRDRKVIALRDRVAATVEPGIHEDQVQIAIKLKNGRTLEKYVEGVKEMVDIVGVDHVSIGTDAAAGPGLFRTYDPFPRLVDAMLRGGLTVDDTAKIMGGNYLRIFAACVG